MYCVKAQKGDGKAEGERPHNLERALPKCNRKIIVLALMMDNVTTPKEIDLMAHPVGPIVGEVHKKKQYNPVNPGYGKLKEGQIRVYQLVDADRQ